MIEPPAIPREDLEALQRLGLAVRDDSRSGVGGRAKVTAAARMTQPSGRFHRCTGRWPGSARCFMTPRFRGKMKYESDLIGAAHC